ncbi:MAG TPA: helix-turn-helix domain-containing protein [Chlamydiales bacterium]|nr:helix-turn-helix domain-containing protein [Chlamydiales bacterium]
MKKPKRSEKLFLEESVELSRRLQKQLHGLLIGELISLMRHQLGMSQRVLARRANVPQSTISNIESGRLQSNFSIIQRILNAMECDLLISVVPREKLENIRKKQAEIKAGKMIRYLEGTMSLEEQNPDKSLMNELFEEKVNRLLDSYGPELWEEDL